ncbi:hypothetical protein MKW98_015204 [Papaver atlanticum]|uniref:F-box domain-containing protein n=1 Tax=Papaver atlanticum TaxID=357466 RepID=A0AAD4XTT5_9MAGN|nr:hypothetical protein MKW98_015204 [Papaver atlanticum]
MKRRSSTSSSPSSSTSISSSFSCNEDRISNLPDPLIHHILSFMYTKYAVQTCVLSKRWRYIWTSLPVLNFCEWVHYRETGVLERIREEPQTTKRFIKFVTKVLSRRDDSDIQRFRLQSSLKYLTTDILYRCINRCITIAVSHNVQELYIQVTPDWCFEVPPCLCTCESLTKLRLDLCAIGEDLTYGQITLPSIMSLPRLKSLHLQLEYLLFTDERLTNKFFSCFPTLESLVIKFLASDQIEFCGSTEFVFGGMNLKISLPALKHFRFSSTEDDMEGLEEESNNEVTLNAPSLSSFILDSYMSTSFTLENLSSLVNADIEINIHGRDKGYFDSGEDKKELYARHFLRFFRGIHKVKILTLRHSFIMALGGAPEILDGQQLEFYNLQRLELWTYLSRDCLHSIFYVLKISPNIESVYLKISQDEPQVDPYFGEPQLYPNCDEVKFNTENIGDYWEAGFSLPCMICHLKFVKIKEHLKISLSCANFEKGASRWIWDWKLPGRDSKLLKGGLFAPETSWL